MNSWRDQVLKEFVPNLARLTIVADPDGLLLEEGILEGVRERGFEMIPFDDRFAFRFAYESKFRSHWDRGEQTDVVVLLRFPTNDLSGLPHDLLLAGRRLNFNLADVFPNLSYSVVAALDQSDLDTLYEALKRYAPGPLGDNATKEFVLRHVFEIAPELIKQPSDLLRILLRRHYRGRRIPTLLDERFIQLLRQNNFFDEWPLERIVSDRETFLAFLQERWPIFLDSLALDSGRVVREIEKSYQLAINGPVDLPFDHDDIRAYIDNLFVGGLMHPVAHENANILSGTWAVSGIRTVPVEDRSRRIVKLVESLQASIPADDAKYTDWFNFARGWAELILLMAERSRTLHEDVDKNVTSLRVRVDAEFSSWLMKRYAGLINLPPVPPVMLHHLPRFLDREMGENRDLKIALIVMDGLAMDQWLVVRGVIASKQLSLRFREHSIFAWVPSLTTVSRQAAFSGKPPMFFPNSIYSTDKEPALWMQFWADQGLAPNEVVYMKGLGDGDLAPVSEMLSHPKVRVAGLVVDKVDRIMHGMELGTAGMHNQVGQWAERAYMSTLLTLLLDQDFRVYLTSDHGNIEAVGCGRPAEGAFADLRGERVRVYPDVALRDKVKDRFPGALEWPTIGIPENYLPLLAPARQAFIQESERTVTHGGISVEELIVPFVQIERSAE